MSSHSPPPFKKPPRPKRKSKAESKQEHSFKNELSALKDVLPYITDTEGLDMLEKYDGNIQKIINVYMGGPVTVVDSDSDLEEDVARICEVAPGLSEEDARQFLDIKGGDVNAVIKLVLGIESSESDEYSDEEYAIDNDDIASILDIVPNVSTKDAEHSLKKCDGNVSKAIQMLMSKTSESQYSKEVEAIMKKVGRIDPAYIRDLLRRFNNDVQKVTDFLMNGGEAKTQESEQVKTLMNMFQGIDQTYAHELLIMFENDVNKVSAKLLGYTSSDSDTSSSSDSDASSSSDEEDANIDIEYYMERAIRARQELESALNNGYGAGESKDPERPRLNIFHDAIHSAENSVELMHKALKERFEYIESIVRQAREHHVDEAFIRRFIKANATYLKKQLRDSDMLSQRGRRPKLMRSFSNGQTKDSRPKMIRSRST